MYQLVVMYKAKQSVYHLMHHCNGTAGTGDWYQCAFHLFGKDLNKCETKYLFTVPKVQGNLLSMSGIN